MSLLCSSPEIFNEQHKSVIKKFWLYVHPKARCSMSQGVRERELKHSFRYPLSFKRQKASFMFIWHGISLHGHGSSQDSEKHSQTHHFTHLGYPWFISLSTFPAHLVYHMSRSCCSAWIGGLVSFTKIIPLILKSASLYLDIVVSSLMGKISSSLQRLQVQVFNEAAYLGWK